MEIREKYVHTRNYGCRIRHFIRDGLRMVSIENKLIKAVFALDKGADILELVYKPEDVDYMWHSFNELKNIRHQSTVAPEDGNFLDSYAGGWQELFPTYGSPASLQGGRIGIHGEACLYPWECETLEDTPECVQLKFILRTIRTPFVLEKTVCITEGSAVLKMRQKVTNTGAVAQEFMWGHHPAFGWPFIDENVRIKLAGEPDVAAAPGAAGISFAEPAVGKWPFLKKADGSLADMSRAYTHEDKIYMEYGISRLTEGRYEVINEKLGLGIRMDWDLSIFPYVWVWGMYCGNENYPWFGRAYTLAVELWSSMPGDFREASLNGTTLKLKAGESMETAVLAELFRI